jgi:hypothetical protein
MGTPRRGTGMRRSYLTTEDTEITEVFTTEATETFHCTDRGAREEKAMLLRTVAAKRRNSLTLRVRLPFAAYGRSLCVLCGENARVLRGQRGIDPVVAAVSVSSVIRPSW